jgi:hypothetical protein
MTCRAKWGERRQLEPAIFVVGRSRVTNHASGEVMARACAVGPEVGGLLVAAEEAPRTCSLSTGQWRVLTHDGALE